MALNTETCEVLRLGGCSHEVPSSPNTYEIYEDTLRKMGYFIVVH